MQKIRLGKNSYNIWIEENGLEKAGQFLDLKRKVMIITDKNIPTKYAKTLASACKEPFIIKITPGEVSKRLKYFAFIQKKLLEKDFTRNDCVIALGGGVVGDLAGFVASTYMRGIDFYNIPTSTLAQIDASVGGKTAINLDNYKNIIGTFYQPKGVIIDPLLLKTLDKRNFNNGLVEALKMGICLNESLFELFKFNANKNIETIIEKSVSVKGLIVETDEKEKGIRKVLNFGHTIGHGIELNSSLLHGECVALGMLCMCSDDVLEEILPIYEALNLPTKIRINKQLVLETIVHDKKSVNGSIECIIVDTIGSYRFAKLSLEEISQRLDIILED